MVIDFDSMPEVTQQHFKGGLGEMASKTFFDGHVRVFLGRLTPGSTIGLHTHDGTSEVIHILSGTGKALCGKELEPLSVGSCHYCPPGEAHSLINDSAEDLSFFAVVSDHRSCS